MVCGKDLKKCKSRELRSSILYTSCDCIKRNGLQDSCPRSECQGQPACMIFPEPLCCPAKHAQRYINIRKNIGRQGDKCANDKKQPNCPHCKGPCQQTSSCPQQSSCPQADNSQKSGCPVAAKSDCPNQSSSGCPQKSGSGCPPKSGGCRLSGGSDGDGPQHNNVEENNKNENKGEENEEDNK